ncbi:MAG: GntR family transcriptional regulator [Planctomycetota bacterium]|jgi:GntR family transcriptional regulator
MLLELDHHSGVPIYRQIIDQIRQQIMAAQIPEGRQLMSVREMAATLRVNPMTVSKAYALLEAEGLLERRRGVGLFVARVRKKQRTRTTAELLHQIMTKAAVTAVQLGIPQKEASKMLAELYRKYDSKTRR